MGSAPYLGGGFGHFYAYAPTKIEYAIDRFAMEAKRQLDVLDRRLAESEYVAGNDYTIADIAIWPWYGGLAKGVLYGAGEFLTVQEYKNVRRWADAIGARPAVQAWANGQPRAGRPCEPAARAPRRRRFRHQDAGQAGGSELSRRLHHREPCSGAASLWQSIVPAGGRVPASGRDGSPRRDAPRDSASVGNS